VDTSQYAATFTLVDADNDGAITADELKRLMELLGDQVTMEQAEEVIGKLDTDGDGRVTLEEFAGYMSGAAGA